MKENTVIATNNTDHISETSDFMSCGNLYGKKTPSKDIRKKFKILKES